MLLLGAVQGCAVLDHLSPSRQRGLASWYGPGFYGETTAGGTVYTGEGLTAAHPWFPFGTRVRVTNLENGRRVVVVIDDRGPFVRGRSPVTSPYSRFSVRMRVTASSSRARETLPARTAATSAL